MKIKTIIGEVNVERQRKYRSVGTVTVKVIMMKDGDRDQSFTLEHHLYGMDGIRRRRDVTARVMWEAVEEMLKDRDDLEGMTVRGVTVVEENQIWSTPFDEMYPKDEEGNRS